MNLPLKNFLRRIYYRAKYGGGLSAKVAYDAPKEVAVFFWCSASEADGVVRTDKFRPPWYNKRKTFKSLLNAAKNAGLDVYVAYDGPDNDYSNYLRSQDIKEFLQFHKGNARECLRELYPKIYSVLGEYNHIYIAEDDYLYLPGAFKILLEGIRVIGHGALFTLYDHPYHYNHNDDITQGRDQLALTPSTHWRTSESACYSFCLNRGVLQSFRKQLTQPLDDRVLFRYLYFNNIRVWSPIPSQASHMNTGFMAPFVDWQKFNDEVKE